MYAFQLGYYTMAGWIRDKEYNYMNNSVPLHLTNKLTGSLICILVICCCSVINMYIVRVRTVYTVNYYWWGVFNTSPLTNQIIEIVVYCVHEYIELHVWLWYNRHRLRVRLNSTIVIHNEEIRFTKYYLRHRTLSSYRNVIRIIM